MHAAMIWPEYNIFNDGHWPANLAIITSSSITIRGNVVHESYGEGIGLFHTSHDCIVEDNVCYANRAVEIYLDHSYNNIVRRNLCYGTMDSTFHRNGSPSNGLWVNDENRHDIYSENNHFYHNLVAYCRVGFGLGSTRDPDSCFRNSVVYNNTFVDCEIGFHKGYSCYDNSYIRNNIVWGISPNCTLFGGGSSTSGLAWEHNNWSSPVSGSPSGTGDVIGIPQLQKTMGWRSMKGGDLKASDFALQPTSPLIDKGTTLGAQFRNILECDKSVWTSQIMLIDQDSQGSGWEIGADIHVANPTALDPPSDLKIVSAP